MTEDTAADPITKEIIHSFYIGGPIARFYQSQVEHIAYVNGTKAAVEVYLIAAKTGKLPEKLPDYLPKDPYTGRDFIYEKTDDGFVLHCQSDNFRGRKEYMLRWLTFKVQK